MLAAPEPSTRDIDPSVTDWPELTLADATEPVPVCVMISVPTMLLYVNVVMRWYCYDPKLIFMDGIYVTYITNWNPFDLTVVELIAIIDYYIFHGDMPLKINYGDNWLFNHTIMFY